MSCKGIRTIRLFMRSILDGPITRFGNRSGQRTESHIYLQSILSSICQNRDYRTLELFYVAKGLLFFLLSERYHPT